MNPEVQSRQYITTSPKIFSAPFLVSPVWWMIFSVVFLLQLPVKHLKSLQPSRVCSGVQTELFSRRRLITAAPHVSQPVTHVGSLKRYEKEAEGKNHLHQQHSDEV